MTNERIVRNWQPDWQQVWDEVVTGMRDWRVQHPKATLKEIEEALDARLAVVRARMLQDAALASAAADFSGVPAAERPCCPHCGVPLQARGKKQRHLRTRGDQPVTLDREHGSCPQCGQAFFPSGCGTGAAVGAPDPVAPGASDPVGDLDPLL